MITHYWVLRLSVMLSYSIWWEGAHPSPAPTTCWMLYIQIAQKAMNILPGATSTFHQDTLCIIKESQEQPVIVSLHFTDGKTRSDWQLIIFPAKKWCHYYLYIHNRRTHTGLSRMRSIHPVLIQRVHTVTRPCATPAEAWFSRDTHPPCLLSVFCCFGFLFYTQFEICMHVFITPCLIIKLFQSGYTCYYIMWSILLIRFQRRMCNAIAIYLSTEPYSCSREWGSHTN